MPNWYEAICIKEINWHNGHEYKMGDSIKIIESDMRILSDAGVIGDIKKIPSSENSIEHAIIEPPENEMKSYRRKIRS
jgi:hypothetical protein